MRIYLIQLFTLIIPTLIWTQNLVPNAGFEKFNGTAPSEHIQTPKEFNEQMINWLSPNHGTPDLITESYDPTYFHPNLAWGTLPTKSGQSCVGLISLSHMYSEVIAVQLKEEMKIGSTYEISFWVGFPRVTKGNKNTPIPLPTDFGMLLSLEQIHTKEKIIATPHIDGASITLSPGEWTKVSEVFTPTAPYQFITIGYFGKELFLKRKYLLIDEVNIQEVENTNSSKRE